MTTSISLDLGSVEGLALVGLSVLGIIIGALRYTVARDERILAQALEAVQTLRRDIDAERRSDAANLSDILKSINTRMETIDSRLERRTEAIGTKIDTVVLKLIEKSSSTD